VTNHELFVVQQVEGYVWCDQHGSVHERRRDPFEMGENCRADWRDLWMEEDDQ